MIVAMALEHQIPVQSRFSCVWIDGFIDIAIETTEHKSTTVVQHASRDVVVLRFEHDAWKTVFTCPLNPALEEEASHSPAAIFRIHDKVIDVSKSIPPLEHFDPSGKPSLCFGEKDGRSGIIESILRVFRMNISFIGFYRDNGIGQFLVLDPKHKPGCNRGCTREGFRLW
jgi:hypothetical protein